MAYLTTPFGHAAGGRPAERLMASLGLPQSDDTILRSLKRHPGARDEAAMLRVVGVALRLNVSTTGSMFSVALFCT